MRQKNNFATEHHGFHPLKSIENIFSNRQDFRDATLFAVKTTPHYCLPMRN